MQLIRTISGLPVCFVGEKLLQWTVRTLNIWQNVTEHLGKTQFITLLLKPYEHLQPQTICCKNLLLMTY